MITLNAASRPCETRPLLCALAALLMLGYGDVLNAHEAAGDPEPPARPSVYAPRPTPDRILLTWTDDPARSLTVTWRTDDTVDDAAMEIAVAGHGPDFVDEARRVEAETTPLQTHLGLSHYHTARATGLDPATKYAYRVGHGDHWSAWNHATTAAAETRPFSFVYFGDAQNDVKSMWSRVVREAFGDAPDAAFMLHAGDLVNVGDRDEEWGEWFEAGGWIHATVPTIAVPGNHEYHLRHRPEGDGRGHGLTPHWAAQMAFPDNGPESLRGSVYYIDYQDARVIALNSNEQLDVQARWLAEVLSDNPQRWTIVTFHHPVQSAADDRDNPEIREKWGPLLASDHVDLVLQGHDHTYARGQPFEQQNLAEGVTAIDKASRTIFVVSVSGPKMYGLDLEPWMKRAAQRTQLYQIIRIDGDTLSYEARTATGTVYDQFQIIKRPRVIETEPGMPERAGNKKAKP